MKHKNLLPILTLIMSVGLTSCQSASETDLTESSSDVTSETEAGSTTELTLETTITESTTTTTESEIVETEFVSSLPYMRYVDFDGSTLSDGIYFISNCVYDADRLGVTCSVCSFPYLLKGDIDLLNEGDTLVYGDYDYKVTAINSDDDIRPVSFVNYSLEKQFNDQYFLDDGCDYRLLGNTIAEEYHIDIAPDIVIWQGYIFGISKEDHDSWYLNKEYFDQCKKWGFTGDSYLVYFESIDELIAAWDQECEYGKIICNEENMEYGSRMDGYYPGGLVVIKDQTITELYLNPWQHQPLFFYTGLWNEQNKEE